MKKLLIALVATAAVSTVFAKIPTQQGFETDKDGFVAADPSEDASDLKAYADASEKPSTTPVPYPFTSAGYGDSYLDLDTGDTTLWCTNSGDATYFDMFMQFNPSATAPELDVGTKIAVFLNSASNLVVISGPNVTTNTLTGTTLAPGTWGRLTLSATNSLFTVSLNGTSLGSFASLTGDATVQSVGFKGTGALENYVARTSDPLISNPAVSIGGEYYASIEDAIADDPTATPQLEANASLATPLAYGESISVKLNNHTLSGITSGSLIALESTSGDVTTYTAGYFPRTATAGQDGTAAHPYEIADGDDLLALQAAVLADEANETTFASKSYVQTNNIDMTGVEGFWGIGWFTSSDAKDSSITASGNIEFTGVFDGAGYTISNAEIVRHNYAGIFNCIRGATIKDLVVSNVTFSGTCSEEGFAIVGNSFGDSVLENLTSAGTWPAAMRHNAAGIAVRAQHNTLITGCVNRVSFTTSSKRLGGILAFSEDPASASDPGVRIYCCTNYGNLESSDGTRGVAGILSRSEASSDKTTIGGCANYGTLTAGSSGFTGAIVGQLDANTYTDDGGNTFPTSQNIVGDYKGRTVAGLAYALPSTIDAVDYLTTVKQADLAAGNTYTLVANVGAGTVYTFDAVGTIAFNTNGYNFAGTVAGSSTVAVSKATEGSVITYTGVAGVASVNGVAYATFAEAMAAVADAPEGQQFVTLLADASVEFDETGISLDVRENSHTLTVTTTGEIAVTKTLNGSTGLATYTTADGVAAVKNNDTGVVVWYASFAAAYEAAKTAGVSTYPDLTVKISGDFTPDISESQFVNKITFISSSEDPVTINLANSAGTYYMDAERYDFPSDSKLILAHDYTLKHKTYLIGGTLSIPAGITVTFDVNPYDGFDNITGLEGAGKIVVPDRTVSGHTWAYWLVSQYSRPFPVMLQNSAWQGTVQLTGSSDYDNFVIGDIGNANSKVCFNGFSTPLWGGAQGTAGVELVGDGLTITGVYESARTSTIEGAVTGSGKLCVDVRGTSHNKIIITGDASAFAGSIEIADTANCAVYFGNAAGNGNCISVAAGKTLTVAAGKTWTANGGFVVAGDLTVDGALSTTDKVYGNGTIRFTSVAGNDGVAMGASWSGNYYGMYYLPYQSDSSARIAIMANVGATNVINGSEGSFYGYPSFGNAAPTVNAPVVLNADWTIANGWSGTANTTTFAKLSGTGNLTVAGSNSGNDPIYYTITELDGYTGTLGGRRGAFTIGRVDVTTQPTNGAIVVKTAIGANGAINDNVPLYVAGVDTGKTLTYNASGAYGAGLYYIEPVVSYTITLNANGGAVDPASTNYTADTAAFDLPVATTSNVGVQFAGWTNETITVAFTNFVPGTTAALGDITLYAKWETTGSTSYGDGTGNTFSIDAGAAATASENLPAGKTLNDAVSASSSMTYAQAYALGLLNETTGAVDELDATIELKDGKVVVNLSSAPKSAYTVTLKVYEKQSLTDAWPAEPTQTYTLDSTTATTGFTPGGGVGATANFYKTEVSISNK